MGEIQLNDPIAYNGKTYTLLPVNKLGIEMYGILIQHADGTGEVLTFNDINIAKTKMYNMIYR